MLSIDQREIKKLASSLEGSMSKEEQIKKIKPIAKKCHIRASRVQEILNEIKVPVVTNIGLDGSRAVIILTMHSYLSFMEDVLALYKKCYEKDPNSVAKEWIPSLIDRIMILKRRRQLYGTHWLEDNNNNWFLVPVEDFANVNKRRAKYGLDSLKRPHIPLPSGKYRYPLGKGVAKHSDQRNIPEDIFQLNFVFMDESILD